MRVSSQRRSGRGNQCTKAWTSPDRLCSERCSQSSAAGTHLGRGLAATPGIPLLTGFLQVGEDVNGLNVSSRIQRSPRKPSRSGRWPQAEAIHPSPPGNSHTRRVRRRDECTHHPNRRGVAFSALPGKKGGVSEIYLRLMMKTVLSSIRSTSLICCRCSSCFTAYSRIALQISLAD
jgi:hypothetical protein